MTKSVSQNELAVVQLLIEHDSCSIVELEGYLNVTATAVRQRLNRMLAAGLIDRTKESTGRGRPTHQYWLTESGRKLAGNNLADFAAALWQEIQMIPDDSIRQGILSGVAHRLATHYDNRIAGENEDQSLEDRLNSIAKIFGDREIPVVVETTDGLPVLKLLACPYPELAIDNREVCDMEKELFSEFVGGDLERCQCRQEGDSCCSYQAAPKPK